MLLLLAAGSRLAPGVNTAAVALSPSPSSCWSHYSVDGHVVDRCWRCPRCGCRDSGSRNDCRGVFSDVGAVSSDVGDVSSGVGDVSSGAGDVSSDVGDVPQWCW